MNDQNKSSIPNFFYSSIGVILINILIFALIYVIISSDFAVSMITLLATIIILLILDKKGLINEIFTIFIQHKKVAFISTIILMLIFPMLLADKRYIAHIAIIVTIYGMAALGLNFQMGSTDMVNFAPAAFMGIGAYTLGVFTSKLGMSPWIGLAVAIITSGIMGLLIGIPTLRTKSYYLSLVTMAIQLAFTMVLFNIPYLGGPNGITGVKPMSFGNFSLVKSYTVFGFKMAPQIPYLYLCLIVLALFIFIAMRVYISRIGLSLNTIAQDEVAANCMGVNITARKLFAFVIGAIFCGVAGALYGSYTSYVGPDDFGFPKSLMIICMVILGGMDNTIGVVTGAFILTVITEKLRVFSDFQQLVYGLILLTVLIVRPAGLIPKRVRNYCLVFKKNIIKRDRC
ncbi:MAG: branched-chain amino acid ABC transporter permease [Dehalobacterium sp.]